MDQMMEEVSEAGDALRAQEITRDEYLARIMDITSRHQPNPAMPEHPGVLAPFLREVRDRAATVSD